ncbi:hypothetical protein BKA65DRAFT_559174 [Rhexocercosporidium sp. MPI-PUGE-AT-0058]|nr:hypothetical protein BKA65DRAFT_559174 [Rhexocercosporidium sp. MPI-PUGE-AT-0058]
MSLTQTPRPTTNDLWASAAAELSDKDRENINFSCPDKLGILFDLLELTTRSKQECIKKRWRYARKSGETIIFVDLFTKMAKWIDLFKQVGDTAVQYDPVHAALPWAGVRFLLQIAVNDIDKYAFVVESATSIAEIICRYAIFEDVYLQSPSAATNELQRALTKFYAAIMTYLSKARSYFDQNTAARRLKSGLLPQSGINLSFDAIATAQETVDRCSSMVRTQNQINQHAELKRLLKCIDGPVERMSVDLASLTDGFEILSGTGQWLLSDPLFNKWKKESVSSILWLHGVPGSGKSKLVSIVIEDAKMAFQKGHYPAPVFFYCSRNTAEPTRSNPDVIMASIARQLSSTEPGCPLLPPTVAAYKKRETEGFASGSLSIDESCALIIQLAKQFPISTIVIDALDECDPEKRADLLEALESILRKSTSLVKIFVSSRDDQDIVWHLRSYPNLELSSDKNKDDIISFIQKETGLLIQRGKLLRWSTDKENLKTKIIEIVTKDASGMFRWASLQLQSLCSLQTDEAIQERLGRLPPKLEELYLELYERLTATAANADRKIATGAFSWLLCAQRTLKSKEFLAALSNTVQGKASKLTIEQVLHLCSNLVIYDRTLDVFRFAHLSVREFLEKRPEYTTVATNSLAAETSLLNVLGAAESVATRRFLVDLSSDLSKSLGSSELTPYSTVYWASHCQLAATKRTNGTLKEMLYHFFSTESDTGSAFMAWAVRLKKYFQEYSIRWELRQKLLDTEANQDGALFIASCFDFQEFASLPALCQEGARNKRSKKALEVAAAYGNCRFISEIIRDKETRIEEQVVKAAAGNYRNGKEVMKLLLEQRGADVVITEAVVTAAAENNKSGEKVMKLLLEKRRADMVITEAVFLAAAGNRGNGREVMKLLLEKRGADIVITEAVVKAVADRFDQEIMKLLLEQRGADMVITEAVVKAVAERFDQEIMELLLEQRGADIVITEAVVKAAVGNSGNGREVMKLLLEKRGADMVITEAVVKAVAERFDQEIMKLLLEQRGADIVITEAVVKAAAGNSGNGREVMKLLLEKRRAEVVITEAVVEAAAGNSGNGREVMKLLLEKRRAEVVITEAVVEAAAGNSRNGGEVMMLLLVKRGADVVITDSVVQLVAKKFGREAILTLLEKSKEDVAIALDVVRWIARGYGRTAIQILVTKQWAEKEVPEFLQECLHRSSHEDDQFAQFYNAAKTGDERVIRELLGQEVDPEIKNSRDVSPLWIAASCGRFKVVQLLLDTRVVNVNSKSRSGRTPVSVARAFGHNDIAHLLVQAGDSHVTVDDSDEEIMNRLPQDKLIERRLYKKGKSVNTE